MAESRYERFDYISFLEKRGPRLTLARFLRHGGKEVLENVFIGGGLLFLFLAFNTWAYFFLPLD